MNSKRLFWKRVIKLAIVLLTAVSSFVAGDVANDVEPVPRLYGLSVPR